VCGAHLLHGREPPGATPTAKVKLRGGKPDASADWILLLEAVEESILRDLRDGLLAQAGLVACGAAQPIVRGIYRLQFSLSHAELTP